MSVAVAALVVFTVAGQARRRLALRSRIRFGKFALREIVGLRRRSLFVRILARPEGVAFIAPARFGGIAGGAGAGFDLRLGLRKIVAQLDYLLIALLIAIRAV